MGDDYVLYVDASGHFNDVAGVGGVDCILNRGVRKGQASIGCACAGGAVHVDHRALGDDAGLHWSGVVPVDLIGTDVDVRTDGPHLEVEVVLGR